MGDRAQLPHPDRVRLDALRHAVNEDAATYVAIMRLFTGEIAGLLSDQSAAEVTRRLAEQGVELSADTVDARLSYLVEHGNLARSPRETEARSLREYLQNRARYQLTQRGELVARHVEDLLGHTESAREVSTEMLAGILAGLRTLAGLDEATLARTEADVVAGHIGTVFAQFERLVSSTRDFYTYLSQVLVRYDLDRAEFQVFKGALLDYLQRFVDEIARHLPRLAETLTEVEPRIPQLCARANAGQRLIAVDGSLARRGTGLVAADWQSLHAWFIGGQGRDSDAAGVRRLATEAMRALLANLRRIATSGARERSRYGDLLTVASWFDSSDDATAHALWCAVFGLYPSRHLAFTADDDGDPLPPTASWWRAPAAEVPVSLRRAGIRAPRGRGGRREDYGAAKTARLAERAATERRRATALREVAARPGPLGSLQISDDARAVLLELHSRALGAHGRPLGPEESAGTEFSVDGTRLRLEVRRTPGHDTSISSPAGRMELADLTLSVVAAAAGSRE